jgi:peptidoglycan/xylan/chitin deacetylase (PgdA/CDA1 family)
MNRRLSCCLALVALLSSAAAFAARAEEPTQPQQCWTKQALAGTAAELKAVHSPHPLDLTPLRQVSLPAATPIPPELRGSIRGVTLPEGEKLIALTFDLCEENGYVAGYDGRIVDLLRQNGVKATFFAGGKWLETHPERAEQLIADPLFEIGSHGLRHYDLSLANDTTLADEIKLTEAAYVRADQRLASRQCLVGTTKPEPSPRITVMRFPYGRCSAKALAAVADQGMLAIQWDLVTRPACVSQGDRAQDSCPGSSRRHHRRPCQRQRPAHRRSPCHGVAEAEGTRLQLCHRERIDRSRKASHRPKLLSEPAWR